MKTVGKFYERAAVCHCAEMTGFGCRGRRSYGRFPPLSGNSFSRYQAMSPFNLTANYQEIASRLKSSHSLSLARLPLEHLLNATAGSPRHRVMMRAVVSLRNPRPARVLCAKDRLLAIG